MNLWKNQRGAMIAKQKNMSIPFVKFSKAGDVKFYAPSEIIDCFAKAGFVKDHVSIKGMVQIVSMRKV